MFRTLLSTLALAALTACSSIPVTSMPRLMGLDMQTMELKGVEAAVRVPEDFQVRKDSVKLAFEMTNGLGERETLNVPMQPSSEGLTPWLRKQQKNGYEIYRFYISDDDAAALSDMRARMKEFGAKTPGENQLSMSVNSDMCLTPGANPFQDLFFEVYLRETPSKDFFKLIKNTKLPITNKDGDVRYCEDEAE